MISPKDPFIGKKVPDEKLLDLVVSLSFIHSLAIHFSNFVRIIIVFPLPTVKRPARLPLSNGWLGRRPS